MLIYALSDLKQQSQMTDLDVSVYSGWSTWNIHHMMNGRAAQLMSNLWQLEDVLNCMGYTLAAVQIGQVPDTVRNANGTILLRTLRDSTPGDNLAKVGVEGSNPFARSSFPTDSIAFPGQAEPSEYACSLPPWHVSDTQGAQP